MKLAFVEMCGFRGFRDRVRLDIPAGFAVINGRNGVGKSTICDAVEFALTGAIDKYRVEKAAKETLADYLWWRGDGTPDSHYVKVGFIDEGGDEFLLTRTRESGADISAAEIQRRLCVHNATPSDALDQICRTSIIRDEWISALSFDLSDTARFDLVRTALGALEGPNYLNKAADVLEAADLNLKAAEEDEREARTALDAALVELSEAQSDAQRNADIAASLRILQSELPELPTDMGQRLVAARTAIVQRRQNADVQLRALDNARTLAPELARISSADFTRALKEIEETVAQLVESKRAAEEKFQHAEQQFKTVSELDSVAASLAALIEHGEHLGLREGHCPLCDASRSTEQFEAALASAKLRLDVLGKNAAAAQEVISKAKAELASAARALDGAQQRLADLQNEQREARNRETAILRLGQRADARFSSADPLVIEKYVQGYQTRLTLLERATIGLEASRAVDRVAALEAKVTSLRNRSDDAASRVTKLRRAAVNARALDHAVKRTNAEIIDERLATISPLLNELYQRLRPHTEWRSIDYRIRGDVRRFLSLSVGKNLNPQRGGPGCLDRESGWISGALR